MVSRLQGRNIMAEGTVKELCSLHGSQEAEEGKSQRGRAERKQIQSPKIMLS